MGSMGFFTSKYDEKTGRRYYLDSKDQKAYDESWKTMKACGYSNESADSFARWTASKVKTKTYSSNSKTKDPGFFGMILVLLTIAVTFLVGFSVLICLIRLQPYAILELFKYKLTYIWIIIHFICLKYTISIIKN